jgi:hypothetical protein
MMENLTGKRGRVLKNIYSDKAQLTETMKRKVQAKAQRIKRYEKWKPGISRVRC